MVTNTIATRITKGLDKWEEEKVPLAFETRAGARQKLLAKRNRPFKTTPTAQAFIGKLVFNHVSQSCSLGSEIEALWRNDANIAVWGVIFF